MARYGEDGNLVGARYSRGKAFVPAVIRKEYDSLSRETGESYFDDRMKLTVAEDGYAKRTVEWTGEDKKTIRYYGGNGELILKRGEPDCAVETLFFDANGRTTSIVLSDTEGKKHVSKLGWSEVRFECDRYGYVSKVAYYGPDGRPVLGRGFYGADGVAAIRRINDMAGNTLEESFYGLDGRLMNLANGHARMRMSFDEKNRPVETLCFDQDNRPVNIRSADCTRIVFEYAPAGYKCRARHYSVSGERTDMIYDERGQHIGTEFYLSNGDRRADRNGVAEIRFKRDAAGREIKRGYFGIDGHRCLSEDLIAGWNTIYDADGNRIEESFIGLDGGLVNGHDGVAINRWTFDADGHETGRTFYDVHTNLVANPRGHAGTRWKYDTKGRMIEEFQIGTDGRPAVDETGVHVVRFSYDDVCQLRHRTFYDDNGNCVTNKDGVAGWASEVDENGREIKRMWKDERGGRLLNGGGYGWMRKYDESDRIVEEWQLEADGTTPRATIHVVNGCPLALKKVAFKYDKIGRKTAISQAAAPGGALGGDKIVAAYTLDGDEAELRTVDAEGRLVNNRLGWARREVRYNEYREPTVESYWDRDGNPATQLATGVSRCEAFYRRNSSGLTVESHTYGTNGYHVVDRQNGWAMSIVKYDRLYRLRSFEIFDESGKPAGCRGSRLTEEFVTYAKNGRIAEIRFVSLDGKGLIEGSVSGYRFEFDSRQDGKVRIVSLDAKGATLASREVSLDECDQFQSRFMVRYSAKLANGNL